MYIGIVQNNGKPYLKLLRSKDLVGKSGNKFSHKIVILNIGPLENFDDGNPNYVERLRQSFRDGKPIIPELQSYCDQEKQAISSVHEFKEGDPEFRMDLKYCSNIIFERIFEELGIQSLIAFYKKLTKIKYDVYGFFKLLVFGKILDPTSKCATVLQNDSYFRPNLKNFNPNNIYNTFSSIAEIKNLIVKRINKILIEKKERKADTIYYGVTNFYFEIDEEGDETWENENIINVGFGKGEISKEERRSTIVQLGLFMDENGLPIGVETFSGNTLDHMTLKKALSSNIESFEFSRYIYISDRDICVCPN
ncbi:MAG: hypothetical protein LBF12_07295 [Christensenellaceae bacterium]|jgi:hypothetical protein|nr:hypothetical protein [Christensenellaceae bacterium]